MRTFQTALASLFMVALPALMPEASGATTHTVKQIGLTFSPQNITIDQGDSVQWLWNTGLHTVTENQGAFNSPLDSGNTSVTLTFDAAFLAANPRLNNRYDYHCAFHIQFGMVGSVTVNVPDPWVDLGFGLAGTHGIPALAGQGPMSGNSSNSLDLTNARTNALCILFVTVGPNTPTPFAGGTIATVPVSTLVVLNTGASGAVPIPFVLPTGVPTGTLLTFQYGIDDPVATQGAALSNALQVKTP